MTTVAIYRYMLRRGETQYLRNYIHGITVTESRTFARTFDTLDKALEYMLRNMLVDFDIVRAIEINGHVLTIKEDFSNIFWSYENRNATTAKRVKNTGIRAACKSVLRAAEHILLPE